MARPRWLLAWAVGAVAFGGASLLVPLYVVALGGTAVDLGVLAALAAFVGAPGALVVGRVADRTGRYRVFVVVTLAVVTATLAVLPFVERIALVVVGNAVVWFAFAAAAPAINLLTVVGHPERAWGGRIAMLNRSQGYGWAGGLVLGTAWTAIGDRFLGVIATQRSFFVACAACAGVATVAAGRWLPPEPTAVPRPSRLARAIARSRRFSVRGATMPFAPGRLYWTTRTLHPRRFVNRFSVPLVAYYGAVLVCFAGFAAFFAPLPLFLGETGFGGDTVFALYLASSVASALLFVPAGELADRYDVGLLNAGGLATRAVALPLVALAGLAVAGGAVGLLVMGGLFVVVGATWAVIAVTAATLVTRLAPASIRGEALGVYTALSSVAGGVGSVLGGWLAGTGYPLAFGVAGGLVAVGAAVVLVVRRLAPRPSPAPRADPESID